MNRKRVTSLPSRPRKVEFSLYDLTDASPPPEPAEDLKDFIDRISNAVAKPEAKRPPPVTRQVISRPVASIDTSHAISTLEKALQQERTLSEALRKRVVELEMTVDQAFSAKAAAVPPAPTLLPLPIPSNSSEWRVRLEEIQKRQLEKIVGRGGINITI